MRWITGPWAAMQRRIDIDVLWPMICRNAGRLDVAKAAFAMHAEIDSAWSALDEDERKRQIEALPDLREAA